MGFRIGGLAINPLFGGDWSLLDTPSTTLQDRTHSDGSFISSSPCHAYWTRTPRHIGEMIAQSGSYRRRYERRQQV